MSRERTLAFATILAGCAGEPMPAPRMPTTAQWDDAAAQEVRAEFAQTPMVPAWPPAHK